jgi:1-acyl-sn-glycerol-3-phosphate acyltransferase
MISSLIASAARLLTGAQARWHGGEPTWNQAIYFANHTSNLDFVLLWASLPDEMRAQCRPIAAADYWSKGVIRRALAEKIFRAVLIDRNHVTRTSNPLQPMISALEAGSSLIIFPEGTRAKEGEMTDFKSGIFHLSNRYPNTVLVPVYIDNLSRVLPKGEFLPVPLLCSIHFGAPLERIESESKQDFLKRARDAVQTLSSPL